MAKMNILSVSAELAPWCKTGGLGDVASALPDAILRVNGAVEIARLLPLYRQAKENISKEGLALTQLDFVCSISLGGRAWTLRFWQLEPTPGAKTFFLEAEGLFDTPGLYDAATIDGVVYDNDVRFGLLNYAALEAGEQLFGAPVDVFHVHDWHAGLLPLLLKTSYKDRCLKACSVITIHNLAYQGWYAPGSLPELELGADEAVHFLALGIAQADCVTTVSPQYAREIQTSEFGCGLEELLQDKGVVGILNGVDLDVWNPQTDPHLQSSFSAEQFDDRMHARNALLAELNLDLTGDPLLGIVSRFDPQKGLDLVGEIVGDLAERSIRLCVLGSGTADLERQFEALSKHHPKTLAVRVGFDNDLAHRIFAGADMMLIPSRFEPCGLTQLYAMRYGSVPVASAVGGLRDTIIEVEHDESGYRTGTGFLFEAGSSTRLLEAIDRATHLFRAQPQEWIRLATHGMRLDFSWGASAAAYLDCYAQTAARHR
jgi:starch synthase